MIPKKRLCATLVPVLLVLTACETPPPAEPPPDDPTPGPVELCINPPTDQLCSKLPHDITETITGLDYGGLDPKDQRPFDNFSWQSFVALNWPANGDGTPATGPIGSDPDAPRVWQFYINPHDVFGLTGEPPAACAGLEGAEGLPLITHSSKALDDHPVEANAILEAAVNKPLIDRQLNYTLYNALINEVWKTYVEGNNLNTVAGQQAFANEGKDISFPLGYYADPAERTGGEPGAIELKFAWRILDPEQEIDQSRFLIRQGVVHIPASQTVPPQQDLCFTAPLALVGFHIIQRTTGPLQTGGPFPQDWIWSTFEHVDNAPLSADPYDPTSQDAGSNVCAAPSDGSGDFSYYNSACTDCGINQPPALGDDTQFLWEHQAPYAKRYAVDDQFGSQIVRCRSIYSETQEVNDVFQKALAGTVFANYRLVNTQWQGDINPGTTGNVPAFLANTAIESYLQGDSSCLGCHGQAQTAVKGQSGNFSFLLQLAAAGEAEAEGGAEGP